MRTIPETATSSRRSFLGKLAATAAATGFAPLPSCSLPLQPLRRPNIVVVVSDDHRADMFSHAGNPYIETPNFDRMADEGIRFTNAFATTGTCSPSRASILTGKYCHRCAAPRIVWMNNSFHVQETPFPAQFHANGYHSAHIGKWHLGKGHEPKPGYDYWAGFEWLGAYFDTTLHINGEPRKFEGYADDILSEQAAEYIRSRVGNPQPYCLYVGLKAPHLDFDYAPRYEDAFDGVEIHRPDNYHEDYEKSGREMMKDNLLRIEDGPVGLAKFGGNWETYIKSYYRSAMGLDAAIGRILDAVDASGQREDTLVLYTSDQGYSLGEHNLTEKHYAYEQQMRVPMMLRYPARIQPGQVREELVLNIDIAPTLMDLAGLPVPEDMDGRSWRPLLKPAKSPSVTWRQDFFFELASEGRHIPSQLAVRGTRYKLIEYPDYPDYPEFYDLEKDPEENRNRIADPTYASALEKMRLKMRDYKKELDWKPRITQRFVQCHALGPIPKEQAEAARKQLLTRGREPHKRNLDLAETRFAWKQLTCEGENGAFLLEQVGTPADHILFVALPVQWLDARDTYAELRYAPYRFFRGYVNGKLYKDFSIPNHPAQSFNPPMTTGRNLILLEMDAAGPPKIHFDLYATEGSFRLQG